MPTISVPEVVAEHDDHRHLDALAAVHGVAEDRRLGDRQPHVQADEHQHRAGEERNPPPEAEELLVAEQARQQQEHAAREEEPDRRAELREHAVPRALARRRVLDREQHRAAPLAAQPQALAEPAQRQQQRRGDADRWRRSAAARSPPSTRPSSAARRPASPCARCGRRNGRTAPSRSAARGTRWRTSPARQGRRRGVGGREEQPRKHQHRRGGVDVEVEELDGGADQAGEQHLLRRVDRFGGIHRAKGLHNDLPAEAGSHGTCTRTSGPADQRTL